MLAYKFIQLIYYLIKFVLLHRMSYRKMCGMKGKIFVEKQEPLHQNTQFQLILICSNLTLQVLLIYHVGMKVLHLVII